MKWILVVFILSIPEFVFAQEGFLSCGYNDGPGTAYRMCNFCDFINMVNTIIAWLFSMVSVIAVLVLVYAGITLVTSAGNTGALEKAKGLFSNVVIGFVIMLSAWLIVDTLIKSLVQNEAGFGPWNKLNIQCGGVKEQDSYDEDAYIREQINKQSGGSFATPGEGASADIANTPPSFR